MSYLDAPDDSSPEYCASCGKEGDHPYELRIGIYACSSECARDLESQFCHDCGAFLPEEEHCLSICEEPDHMFEAHAIQEAS